MDAVIPYLQQNGGGSIVNCGSTSALRGMGANAYTASKSAVHALIRAAAAQYGKDHILQVKKKLAVFLSQHNYTWCLQQMRFSLPEYAQTILNPFLKSLKA